MSASKIFNESNRTKFSFDRSKTIALTFLLPTVLNLIEKLWMGVMMLDRTNKNMNGSDEVWRWVQQNYVISRFILKFHLTEKNCSDLDVTDSVLSNQRKDEWELCSMRARAPKKCNELNHTKIEKTTFLTFLLSTMFDWINNFFMEMMQYKCECFKKYVISQIILKLYLFQGKNVITLLLATMFICVIKKNEQE